MKVTINLIVLLSSMTYWSCETNPKLPEPKISFNKQIDFETDLQFWNSTQVSKEQPGPDFLQLTTTGVSRAKYLEKFEIQISFHHEDVQPGNSPEFDKGIFKIHGEDGHTLYGSFISLTQQSGKNIEMILKIEGGEGFYLEAGGNILVEGGLDQVYPQLLILEFAGTIIRP